VPQSAGTAAATFGRTQVRPNVTATRGRTCDRKRVVCGLPVGDPSARGGYLRLLNRAVRVASPSASRATSHHPARRQRLAGVTLRVFRRMKQETDDGRGQPGAADLTLRRERRLVGPAKLIERSLDAGVKRRKEVRGGEMTVGLRLLHQELTLCVSERLSPSVGEQTIEAADRMKHMEPDRRRVWVHMPETLRRQVLQDALDFFARLQEAVGDGLKMP